MTRHLDRREFIQLAGLATAGVAGVVFSSGLRGVSLAAAKGRAEDFTSRPRAVPPAVQAEFPAKARLRGRLARVDATARTKTSQ